MSIINKMTEIALAALEDKKGEDLQVIDISEISPIADQFIIASGTNRNQVQAMADAVEEGMHKGGFSLKQVEGYDSANWILMDFVDIVVHIFDRESRSFYDLERIWKDGKMLDLAQLRNEM
ncbi:MAG: ribosome silencing factor [Lachnospiraceae bacterium]|nr:ribosome silencing factor [Lachnospiraceae bacterium]